MIKINLNGDSSTIKVNLQNLSSSEALRIAQEINALIDQDLQERNPILRRAKQIAKLNPDTKLMGVKILKEEFGIGLKEAKDIMYSCYQSL